MQSPSTTLLGSGTIAFWYIYLVINDSLPKTVSKTAYRDLAEACAPSVLYWFVTLSVVIALCYLIFTRHNLSQRTWDNTHTHTHTKQFELRRFWDEKVKTLLNYLSNSSINYISRRDWCRGNHEKRIWLIRIFDSNLIYMLRQAWATLFGGMYHRICEYVTHVKISHVPKDY